MATGSKDPEGNAGDAGGQENRPRREPDKGRYCGAVHGRAENRQAL